MIWIFLGDDLEISRIIWLEDIVDKLLWKHNVEEIEIIEVLENKPKFQYKEKGYKPGEDVYIPKTNVLLLFQPEI